MVQNSAAMAGVSGRSKSTRRSLTHEEWMSPDSTTGLLRPGQHLHHPRAVRPVAVVLIDQEQRLVAELPVHLSHQRLLRHDVPGRSFDERSPSRSQASWVTPVSVPLVLSSPQLAGPKSCSPHGCGVRYWRVSSTFRVASEPKVKRR